MIKITKNTQWKRLDVLFNKNLLKRYDWFLFEFGKRITSWVNKELLGRIEDLEGSAEYKKRLVMTEIRTKDRVWFAIAAKSLPARELAEKSKTQILKVVRRFELPEGRDPIKEILIAYGPWTEESIPFAPSLRQAMVVVKDVTEEEYQATLSKNNRDLALYTKLMSDMGINVSPRFEVKKKLRVVKDLDVQVLMMEAGKSSDGKPHWKPTIKSAKIAGVKKLMTDKDLIRVMTDVNFMRWKTRKHLRIKLTAAEYKQFEKFQREIAKGI